MRFLFTCGVWCASLFLIDAADSCTSPDFVDEVALLQTLHRTKADDRSYADGTAEWQRAADISNVLGELASRMRKIEAAVPLESRTMVGRLMDKTRELFGKMLAGPNITKVKTLDSLLELSHQMFSDQEIQQSVKEITKNTTVSESLLMRLAMNHDLSKLQTLGHAALRVTSRGSQQAQLADFDKAILVLQELDADGDGRISEADIVKTRDKHRQAPLPLQVPDYGGPPQPPEPLAGPQQSGGPSGIDISTSFPSMRFRGDINVSTVVLFVVVSMLVALGEIWLVAAPGSWLLLGVLLLLSGKGGSVL
eukprot:gnl/TRDRNA2_/TRDRNA2_182638_c0_seq1.p1 gnl/TRDRNA2_/TRDRNA2_182638_c0~~gnl/TRDRNA2_/TRDRNA2_182638_c0_seq1.p1  ORF type:complete len:308 (+),score=54.76 gnl/TRDRNA2_/TRDRNA2_182638_c0_seq1:54-977(+)